MANNNIEYIRIPFEAATDRGYTSEGWYFWDEIGMYCYGPYFTRDEAEKKLQQYIDEVINYDPHKEK